MFTFHVKSIRLSKLFYFQNGISHLPKAIIHRHYTVGFIGLGNMGSRMAQNLIKKGEHTILYDKNSVILESLSENPEVIIASSIKDVACNSSYIITMLGNGNDVSSAYLGEDGIIGNSKEGTIFIDCSTIDPILPQELGNIAKLKNSTFLDVPVSGGIIGAEHGTLTFMIGGCKNGANKIEKLLLKMGTRLIYCGNNGMGQTAKLCNNMLLGISMLAVCEALSLGQKFGLDPKLLLSVINTSSGKCWSSEMNPPISGILEQAPSSNNYKNGFKLNLLIKDMLLACKLSEKTNLKPVLSEKALQLYEQAADQGFGDCDFSVIYKYLSNNY